MSQSMTTFVAIVLAIAGAAIGYTQFGMVWGIVGFFFGIILAASISTLLDSFQERESQRRENENKAEVKAKITALIEKLRECGRLDDELASRIVIEDWPLVLVQQFDSGEFSFEECSCIGAGRIQIGLPSFAIECTLGSPDNEKIMETKGKSKRVWTYYAKPDVRRGLLLKATFENDILTDYTSSDEDGLLGRVYMERLTRYGITSTDYVAYIMQKSKGI